MLELVIGVFIFLVLFLKIDKALYLTFIFQNTFFLLEGSFDLGSVGWILLFIRLLFLRKINLTALYHEFTTVKILTFLILFTVFWSISLSSEAFYMIRGYLRAFLSLIVFIVIFKSKQNELKLGLLFSVTFIINVLNTYLISLGIHPYIETYWEVGRLSARGITGQHVNINTMAFSILLLFTLILTELKFSYLNKIKAFTATFLILLTLGIYGSRSSILGVILIVGATFLSRLQISVFAVVLLFFYSVIDLKSVEIPFIGEEANMRIQMLDEEIDGSSEYSRSNLLFTGFDVFVDNFLFGVGTGNVAKSMENYFGDAVMTHNAFMNMLVQFGIIGLLLFMLMLKANGEIILRNFRLGVFFFTIVIFSNLSHDYFQVSLLWMTMFYLEVQSQKNTKNHALER